MTLYFQEPYFTTKYTRVFDIVINGVTVFPSYDPLYLAGCAQRGRAAATACSGQPRRLDHRHARSRHEVGARPAGGTSTGRPHSP